MAEEKMATTKELMNAERRFGFHNGVYEGVPADFILLELPHREPDGSWLAKAVPIANGQMPVAIGGPTIVKLQSSEII